MPYPSMRLFLVWIEIAMRAVLPSVPHVCGCIQRRYVGCRVAFCIVYSPVFSSLGSANVKASPEDVNKWEHVVMCRASAGRQGLFEGKIIWAVTHCAIAINAAWKSRLKGLVPSCGTKCDAATARCSTLTLAAGHSHAASAGFEGIPTALQRGPGS